jgi:hypothetical protein
MMRHFLASLAIFAALICSSNALTDEQIVNQVTDYCTSLGYSAYVDHWRTIHNELGLRVSITVPSLMESGRAKELTDQVMQYASGFDEVWQVSVYAMSDGGGAMLAYSSWRRGG